MGRHIRIDDREVEETRAVLKPVFEGDDDTDEVSIERMKSGDIVCRGLQAAAERKQISDFLGSISDRRIWKQIDAMERQYEHNCVVVEGSHIEEFVADIYGGHAHAIRMVLGTCAYLNMRDGWSAFWIQSDGDDGTRLLAEYILAWFRQVAKTSDSGDGKPG